MELLVAVELLAEEIRFFLSMNQFEDKTECLVQCVLSADDLDTVETHLYSLFSYLLPTLLLVVLKTTCVRSVVTRSGMANFLLIAKKQVFFIHFIYKSLKNCLKGFQLFPEVL